MISQQVQTITSNRFNINTNNQNRDFSRIQNLKSSNSVFEKQERFISLRKDNTNDLFIKDFILSKLDDEDIKLPKNANIKVFSPLGMSHEQKNNLRKIIFGDFKGYSNYFFDLVGQPKAEFLENISNLNIDAKLKKDIINVYNYLDNYYKVEVSIPGSSKIYNLAKLSEEDKKEMQRISGSENKELVEELLEISEEVTQITQKFSRSELERNVLFEAGESSRDFIWKLLAGIGVLTGIDNYVRPAVVSKLGATSVLGKSFNKVTEFVGGCGDDCLGSYKDYYQDEITLGKEKAQKVLGFSIAAGILTSLAAASLNLNTMFGAIAYGNGSSGSSIFSNIATFSIMFKNFDKMIEKGLIKLPKENMSKAELRIFKLKTVWKNYVAYDAYFGKILGILACTPAAIIALKSGAFASQSSVVKAVALTIVGSIESYITMAVQLLRDNARKAKIKTSKEIISKGKHDAKNYDSRKYEVKDYSRSKLALNNVKNFFKSFND